MDWLQFCADGIISKNACGGKEIDNETENDDDNHNNNDFMAREKDGGDEKDQATNYKVVSISSLHVSTKTKIVYLNQPVNLIECFWKVPVMDFYTQENGVVKKQMKFTSFSQVELDAILMKMHDLSTVMHTENYVIASKPSTSDKSSNPFKDIRRITVGVSKRDLLQTKRKTKSAFYNCFVIILRIKDANSKYREFHVKIFNTGKLEIPGIQNDDMCRDVMKEVVLMFQKFTDNSDIDYRMDDQNVLINSNFKAGFFINRERLYDILRVEYNINCIFDPCSYPGIQCKYYFENYISNKAVTSKKRKREKHKVSFMIFRTGSVLIVGMCSDEMLLEVYAFIKGMLEKEYLRIVTAGVHLPKQQKRNCKKITFWREIV